MNAIEEFKAAIDQICKNMEIRANDEIMFCTELQHMIEKTAWEISRQISNLQEISNFYGVQS